MLRVLAAPFRLALGLLALLAATLLGLAFLLLGLVLALGLVLLSLLRGRRPSLRWVGPRPGAAFRRGRPAASGEVIDVEVRERPGPPGPG